MRKPMYFPYDKIVVDFFLWYARVTKHTSKKVAKAEVNLNWLWTIVYALFWLYTVFISMNDLSLFDTSILIGFIISLFLQDPPRVLTKEHET